MRALKSLAYLSLISAASAQMCGAADEYDSDDSAEQTMSGLEMIQRLRTEPFVQQTKQNLYSQPYHVAAATGTLSLAQRQAFGLEKYYVTLAEITSFAALAGHKGYAPKSIQEAFVPEPIGTEPDLYDSLL